MLEDFIKLYSRDLDRLKNEIESFQQEDHLWQITGSVKNSAGNLCLHLVGNLKTYIGKNMGYVSYLRDRDSEFSLKNIAKESLTQQVEETKDIVVTTLEKIQKEQLGERYMEDVLGYEMTTGFFLVHLAAHLSYHLGQINYLRRILEY